MPDGGIRIVVLQGSVRPANYTAKAVGIVLDELERQGDITVELFDPGEFDLPLPGADGNSLGAKRLQEGVTAAAGVIFATPEYHGSFSSVTKLLIENLGFPSMLAGKPVALLGVAAGSIGAIKALEQLRGVCSHVGAIVLPGPVSVAEVRKVFDAAGRCLDASVEARIRKLPHNLIDYIRQSSCPSVCLEAMVRGEATA